MRLPPIPELAAPAPLAAVALLALNDHVLKRAFPGPVTGKLSDLAGCFVLPLFVSAALAVVTRWERPRRLVAGAAFTVASFSAVKLSPTAAAAASRALEAVWAPVAPVRHVIVADPTDLVALVLVAAAVASGLRAGAATAPGRTP